MNSLSKHLTDRMKAEWLDTIIERDGGYRCWYPLCQKPFSLSQSEDEGHLYDHLNNNRGDNRIDNVVLCCRSCNNKKVNDFDMHFLAMDKLHDNEKRHYMREKSNKKSTIRQDSEVQISKENYRICYRYVVKNVDAFGEINFKDTLHSVVYQCRQNNNTGSPQSVYNYLKIICSKESPYEITKNDDGKKVIRRKQA